VLGTIKLDSMMKEGWSGTVEQAIRYDKFAFRMARKKEVLLGPWVQRNLGELEQG
jgi:hypothetical protein